MTLLDSAPAAPPLTSLTRSHDERKRLLRSLLLPIYSETKKADSDYFTREIIERLAVFDQYFALEHLSEIKRESQQVKVLCKIGAIDDALDTIPTVGNAYLEAYAYYDVFDATVDDSVKRVALAEALLAARRISRPDRRAVILGGVAERLFEQGDREGATAVLDEGRAIATELAPNDWSGFARGYFAERLALIDPDGAMELIAPLKNSTDDYVFPRHMGNTAQRLAAIDPVKAEAFLNAINNDNRVTRSAVRVCYGMATVDLDRAKTIADAMNADRNRSHDNSVHAYGVMAKAIAESQPETARELLRTAMDQIGTVGESSWAGRRLFDVSVALLRYAETIDPPSTREFFWRLLSLHSGPHVDVWSPERREQMLTESAAKLVIVLALYDQFPELQKELMGPIFEYWSGYADREDFDFYRQNAVFTAMALSDPEKAIAWHNQFYPKVKKEDRRSIPQPWMTMADALANDGEELGRKISREVFHRWVIGDED